MSQANVSVVSKPPTVGEVLKKSRNEGRPETEESKKKESETPFLETLLGLQAISSAPTLETPLPTEGEKGLLDAAQTLFGTPTTDSQAVSQVELNGQENSEAQQNLNGENPSLPLDFLMRQLTPLDSEIIYEDEGSDSSSSEDDFSFKGMESKLGHPVGQENSGDALLGSIQPLSPDGPGIELGSLDRPAPPEAPRAVPEVFKGVDSLILQGGGKMTVSLQPEHLGQMEIEVKTDGKKVSIDMLSDSHEAKALMEEHVQALRASLADVSLNLEKFEVAVARDGDWTQFQKFSDGSEFQGKNPASARRAFDSQSQMVSGPASVSGPRHSLVGDGRVDLWV